MQLLPVLFPRWTPTSGKVGRCRQPSKLGILLLLTFLPHPLYATIFSIYVRPSLLFFPLFCCAADARSSSDQAQITMGVHSRGIASVQAPDVKRRRGLGPEAKRSSQRHLKEKPTIRQTTNNEAPVSGT